MKKFYTFNSNRFYSLCISSLVIGSLSVITKTIVYPEFMTLSPALIKVISANIVILSIFNLNILLWFESYNVVKASILLHTMVAFCLSLTFLEIAITPEDFNHFSNIGAGLLPLVYLMHNQNSVSIKRNLILPSFAVLILFFSIYYFSHQTQYTSIISLLGFLIAIVLMFKDFSNRTTFLSSYYLMVIPILLVCSVFSVFNFSNFLDNEYNNIAKNNNSINLIFSLYTITITTINAIFISKFKINNLNKSIELARINMAVTTLQSETNVITSQIKSYKDLFKIISFEIRTTLNTTMGLAELINLTDNINEQKKLSNIIYKTSENLYTISNDIADISDIESLFNLNATPFNLEESFEEIYNLIAVTGLKNNNKVYIKNNKCVSLIVLADKNKFQQIMLNLVNICFSFLNDGYVIIELNTSLDKANSEANLMITIKDSSINVEQKFLDDIFKNKSLSKTNQNNYVRKIGFYIAERIANKMGAILKYSASQNMGITFEVNLRVNLIHDLKNQVTKHINCKALLINSDYIDLNIFEHYLNNLGFMTKSCHHPLEAVDQLKNLANIFDIIVVAYEAIKSEPSILDLIEKNEHYSNNVIIYYTSNIKPDLNEKYTIIYPPISFRTISKTVSQIFNPELQKYKSKSANYNLENIKILLVEDTVINQEVANAILSQKGATIEIATTGTQAIKHLEQQNFDIILMDYMLPEMDGIETSAIIRNSKKDYSKTPIIGITANNTQQIQEQCFEVGMNELIIKPYKASTLLEVINKTIHNEGEIGKLTYYSDLLGRNMTDIIDISMIDSLKSIIGDEVKNILNNAMSSIPESISDIRKAYDTKDNETLLLKSHSLKSSAANVGLMSISEYAKIIEGKVRANELNVDNDIKNLEGCLAESMQALRDYLDTLN